MQKNPSPRHKITIVDVAKEAGVSYSTVSRVVNDFHYVSPKTRAKVQVAMEKLGYVANLKARSLAGGRSQMLGLLIYDLDSSYLIELVRGIDAELASQDYDLILYMTHYRAGKESAMVANLTQGIIDGLLVVLPRDLESYLTNLEERQFPYMLIDHAPFEHPSNTICANNWQAGYDATNYLISLGHQRIGFVKGTILGGVNGDNRLAGYQSAIQEHGIEYDPTLIQPGNFYREAGYEAVPHFLSLSRPPTAIIGANDSTALGVMDGLLERNIKVPEDISVIGFDDIPDAAIHRPALTTMRQDLRQMGGIAARRLIQFIENPDQPKEHVELQMELVVRETTISPEQSRFAESNPLTTSAGSKL